MIGSIIGAVGQIGSTIYGGIKSGQYNRKAMAELENRKEANNQWYNQKSAQDYTQRSDVQNILRKQSDLFDERMKRASASNIVAGGTDEALALQQKAAADAVGETMASVAENAAAYKDSLDAQHKADMESYSRDKQSQYARQAQSVAGAAGQAGQAFGTMGQGIDDYMDSRKKATGDTTEVSKKLK